jgi:predicted HTH transcriptional regulator
MLTDEEFADLIQRQHESRHLEFKPPGRRDDPYLFAQVTRAALGMANTQDGGTIILGVQEQDRQFTPTGLSAEQLATWRYDEIAARFAAYADPPFDFDVAVHRFDGMQFVVLEIVEFEHVPILCRADYQIPPHSRRSAGGQVAPPVLRAGACYVRSRRKPETTERAFPNWGGVV